MKKIYKLIACMGLIIILGSSCLKGYTKLKENQAKNNFEEKIETTKEENKDNYNDLKLGDEIGLINIESISLNSVIVHGTNDEQIKHYIGHFENTPLPGEYGNFSIAGHSGTIYNEVFDELHKINIKDEINITSLDGEFTYVVDEVFETKATDIEVLNQMNDRKEMTIVTCTNYGEERLIVKASIKE